MANPFQHPAMQGLLERVSHAFKTNRVWLLGFNQLVFVCGGPASEGANSVRRHFMEWANANVAGFRFFLAEAAAKDVVSYDEPNFLNLSQFEEVLAEIADCVVVIPESVGSWAETGFFSALPEIRKKCLIINHIGEQGDSFLNVGPIQTINEASNYRPTLLVNFALTPINFQVAAEKLQRYARLKKKKLEIDDFNALSGQQQFAIVHYLISIFPSLDINSLIFVVKTIFVRYKKDRIRQIVSVLISVGYLRRIQADQSRFYVDAAVPALLEIEQVTREDLLSENIEFFEKHAPELIPDVEHENAA